MPLDDMKGGYDVVIDRSVLLLAALSPVLVPAYAWMLEMILS